ncbi:hypothetical protein [Rossellomorea vietnamensis]|nr:hypothetical protein [Rossellomorea vietnamensis]
MKNFVDFKVSSLKEDTVQTTNYIIKHHNENSSTSSVKASK